MIAIIARADNSGRIATVGTTNQTIARLKTRDGIRKRAYRYSHGLYCKIEFYFYVDNPYGEPDAVEYINSPAIGGL